MVLFTLESKEGRSYCWLDWIYKSYILVRYTEKLTLKLSHPPPIYALFTSQCTRLSSQCWYTGMIRFSKSTLSCVNNPFKCVFEDYHLFLSHHVHINAGLWSSRWSFFPPHTGISKTLWNPFLWLWPFCFARLLWHWSFLQRPFHIDSSSVHYSQYCQRQLSMFTPSFLRHHWRNSSMVVPNIYSNSNVQCEHGSHSCGELHYHRVPFHTNNFSTDLKLHTRQSMFGHSHTDSPTGPFISPLAGIIFGLIPFAKGMWSGPFGAGAGGGRCRATMCPPFGKCPFGMCPLTMGELGELKVRGEPGPCLRGPVNRNEKIITLDLKYNSDIAVLLFNNFVYFWQNLTGL